MGQNEINCRFYKRMTCVCFGCHFHEFDCIAQNSQWNLKIGVGIKFNLFCWIVKSESDVDHLQMWIFPSNGSKLTVIGQNIGWVPRIFACTTIKCKSINALAHSMPFHMAQHSISPTSWTFFQLAQLITAKKWNMLVFLLKKKFYNIFIKFSLSYL